MLRANVMFLLAVVVALATAFDPEARAGAINMWQEIKPTLIELKDDLAVLMHRITQNTSSSQQQVPPPIDDMPVFNTDLIESWYSSV